MDSQQITVQRCKCHICFALMFHSQGFYLKIKVCLKPCKHATKLVHMTAIRKILFISTRNLFICFRNPNAHQVARSSKVPSTGTLATWQNSQACWTLYFGIEVRKLSSRLFPLFLYGHNLIGRPIFGRPATSRCQLAILRCASIRVHCCRD